MGRFLFLTNHVRDNDLGRAFAAETGFKLTTNPDASFVSKEHVVWRSTKKSWRGASPVRG